PRLQTSVSGCHSLDLAFCSSLEDLSGGGRLRGCADDILIPLLRTCGDAPIRCYASSQRCAACLHRTGNVSDSDALAALVPRSVNPLANRSLDLLSAWFVRGDCDGSRD